MIFVEFLDMVFSQGYADVLDYCEKTGYSMEEAVDAFYKEYGVNADSRESRSEKGAD